MACHGVNTVCLESHGTEQVLKVLNLGPVHHTCVDENGLNGLYLTLVGYLSLLD